MNSAENTEGKFKCTAAGCQQVFNTKEALIEHARTVHHLDITKADKKSNKGLIAGIGVVVVIIVVVLVLYFTKII
ncbi:hypothetical protein [Caldiplasma sukawensis]